MRNLALIAGAALLLGSVGEARASGLWDLPLELKLSFPSISTSAVATPHLVPPDALKLAEAEGGGTSSGTGLDKGTTTILAVVLGLLVGFGTGQFVLGDKAGGIFFLVLEAGLLVGAIVVWAVIAASIVGGAYTISPLFVLFPLMALGYGAARIWDFIDTLFKSGVLNGPSGGSKPAALISNAAPAFAGSHALRPSWANAMVLRF